MSGHSKTHLLLSLLAFAASGERAFAQMSPTSPRSFAYTGTLESNGDAADGNFDLRFGLFTSASPDTSCLLGEAPSCPLWSSQIDGVRVAAGRFTALLDGVPDSALAQDRLWLAIAVKETSETSFVALAGTQEILSTPWAARAAAAKDYKVTGDLTVAGSIESAGAVIADTLYADNGAVIGAPDGAHLETSPNALQSRDGAAPAGLSLNAAGGDLRLGDSGSTVSAPGRLVVAGEMTVAGPATFECPTGWSRNGAWCIEDVHRGGGTSTTLETAVTTCHYQGGAVCPIEAYITCDYLEFGVCGLLTDTSTWLWSSSTYGDDQDALQRIQVYSGIGNQTDNEVDLLPHTATSHGGLPMYFLCCRAAGGH